MPADTTDAAAAPAGGVTRRRPKGRKLILFRVLAVVLSLAPLLLLEAAFRLTGVGRPTDFNDPYVGFSEVHPLFVLDPATGLYSIPLSRQTHFQPASFPAVKPPGEFRVFALGGSTVQGRPFEPATSFTAWLEIGLQCADPSRPWRVVNCGGVSYASYRLVPILEEVLHYDPDLIIVCTGHNEFLEDRSYEHVKKTPPALAWAHDQASRLRTYNVLRGAWLSLRGGENDGAARTTLGPEVDGRLDWEGGLELYHRNRAWRQGVIDHFQLNLRRLAAIAQKADVPLLFVAPVSGLDWPPFKSEHRAGITPAEEVRFDVLLAEASAQQRTDPDGALAALTEAVDIDPEYALAQYELGKWHQTHRDLNAARAAFGTALEEDVCPLRMLPEMRDDMQRIADSTGTPYIDAHELFVRRSPGGITGPQWLVDHIHPTIEGHKLMAGAMLDRMAGLGFVSPASGWEADRDRAYAEHIESLDPTYFARGQERLKGLFRWAHGKVKTQRPDEGPEPGVE